IQLNVLIGAVRLHLPYGHGAHLLPRRARLRQRRSRRRIAGAQGRQPRAGGHGSARIPGRSIGLLRVGLGGAVSLGGAVGLIRAVGLAGRVIGLLRVGLARGIRVVGLLRVGLGGAVGLAGGVIGRVGLGGVGLLRIAV